MKQSRQLKNNVPLVNSVGFDLLGTELGNDLESILTTALDNGVVFPKGATPLSVFRSALETSIRNIESHPKGRLLQQFLLKGPYDSEDDIPPDKVDKYVSDEVTTTVIAFIYSYMINCFKGALTELLATGPCLYILKQLQQGGEIPSTARLYSGDTVWVKKLSSHSYAKGADLHILLKNSLQTKGNTITLVGVGEVKSYFKSLEKLHKQLDNHIKRIKNGLKIGNKEYPPDKVILGCHKNQKIIRIIVQPSTWKLSRVYHYEKSKQGHNLHVDYVSPPQPESQITRVNKYDWNIILRWSKEALAEAAYEMTFWYIGKVGEVIYSQKVPESLYEMTPEEAGRNAAKMMLYYAILRCRTDRQTQRAIALYNSYCFGYSLGMNFRDTKGRREMLWFEDLDEILISGKSKYGSKISN